MKTVYPALLIVLCAASGSVLSATPACTTSTISGGYGYAISGMLFQSSGSFYTFADSGSLTADGNGTFTGSSTFSESGTIASRSISGTYTVNSDCTGSATFTDSLGNSLNINLVILGGGQEIDFIQTDAGAVVSGSAKQRQTYCSANSISGAYGFAISGWYYDSSGIGWGFADSGKLISDGVGNLTLNDTVSQGGTVSNRTVAGNYAVNSDCTGTASIGGSAHLNIAVVAGGEVQFIQTDNSTVISGSANALADVAPVGGSMAQIASGGGWATTFTLANTGTSSAQAELSFFDNNGDALSLPLTLVQSSTTETASALTETIAPGATLIIQTQSNSAAALVGSAQLTTTGDVNGFAIFRYNPTAQEAVVPLETRNASAYVLAFDNTNGLSTGVALANVSGQGAKVGVVVRDDTGAVLDTTTINLTARGHTSFTLSASYASVKNKRGTVEFDTPPGGKITALGILGTPTGGLTTIPVLVK
jgi:hypothetical protein